MTTLTLIIASLALIISIVNAWSIRQLSEASIENSKSIEGLSNMIGKAFKRIDELWYKITELKLKK